MTTAVLVFAPESSGTRLLTRLLVAAGCKGTDDHEQPFDVELPQADGTPIVWRRSFPHGGQWADISRMAGRLRALGYTPKVVALRRNWTALLRSQVMNGHVPDEATAAVNARRAEGHIVVGVGTACITEYYPITYAELVQHPVETLTTLFTALGLPLENIPALAERIYDGDAKYYEAQRVW